jgi:hypothetical protein
MDACVGQTEIDGGYDMRSRMVAEVEAGVGAAGEVIAVDTEVPDLLRYSYVWGYEPDKAVGRVVGFCGVEGQAKDGKEGTGEAG